MIGGFAISFGFCQVKFRSSAFCSFLIRRHIMFCGGCHTLLPPGCVLHCGHHVCFKCVERILACPTCKCEDVQTFDDLLDEDIHHYPTDDAHSSRLALVSSLMSCPSKFCSNELYVSALDGYDDAIEQGLSDHLPLVFTILTGLASRAFETHPRIAAWNILKQCKKNSCGWVNNGFNVWESERSYSERLKKVADLVALLIRLCGIVVLQECPPAGTVVFTSWMNRIVTTCHVAIQHETIHVDPTMSLVTLWDEDSWKLLSTYNLPPFANRTLACQFQSPTGGTICILNVHFPYGGPRFSQQREEHTSNVASVLSDYFSETGAIVSVAVGDYNLDVFSVVREMDPHAQFSAAKLTNSSQSWAGDRSTRSTVDGAVAYIAEQHQHCGAARGKH